MKKKDLIEAILKLEDRVADLESTLRWHQRDLDEKHRRDEDKPERKYWDAWRKKCARPDGIIPMVAR